MNDAQRLAAILAGLRLLQADLDGAGLHPELQDHFADVDVPSGAQIDELCEDLNCGAIVMFERDQL